MGINDRPNPYRGRNDLETLMASPFDRVRASPCVALRHVESLAHTHTIDWAPRIRVHIHTHTHTIHWAPRIRVHIHIKHQQQKQDWITISEMLLGPVPDGFQFQPKHKANSYSTAPADMGVSNG